MTTRLIRRLLMLLALAAGSACELGPTQPMPAFPGAEGFGARATGGRGGRVIYVTNLNPGGPGSLQEALETAGARYILFKVSGVIDAVADIRYGDVTIAGQTSPGGIIVRGLLCDEVYDPEGDCTDIVVRHVRSRPRDPNRYPGAGWILDDALRLDGVTDVIVDHGSFANATDEVVQVSQSRNVTIQNSILAETVGDHYGYGGMLINYSTAEHTQVGLSIHHNMWNRIAGRMPEISCEGGNCAGHRIGMELSNNLLWDAGFPIWYDGFTSPDGGARFFLDLNWVGNYMAPRPGFPYGMIAAAVIEEPRNSLFFSGNRMSLYPAFVDYDLAYCCNDFPEYGPNTIPPVAEARTTRHPFDPITYDAAADLVPHALANLGAFPRDPMDRRLLDWVSRGEFDPTPLDRPGAEDAFDLDFDPADPPPAPADTDADGMPDEWETAHGLDPALQDHNGTHLSVPLTGQAGYTNLEVYLNLLADGLLGGS